jgi:hypothetical protein
VEKEKFSPSNTINKSLDNKRLQAEEQKKARALRTTKERGH